MKEIDSTKPEDLVCAHPKPHFPLLTPVVEDLCSSQNGLSRRDLQGLRKQMLPSRDEIVRIIEMLREVLFPGYFGPPDINDETMRFYVGATLDGIQNSLNEQVKRGLCFVCGEDPTHCPECDARATEIICRFMHGLPEVRQLLVTDVQAAYEGDPAATSPSEAIFCYPGILAITNYRLAHELHVLGVPLIPRIITEHAHSTTGIDIHPGAKIGEFFFIDHGTGVVIGETAVIGKRVRLYQGVTLGAKSFALDDQGHLVKGIPRHPQVEDDVIIYAGATILGRVTIGAGSSIGGNVWLTRSVPPGSRITQAQVQEERFTEGGGI